MVDFGVGVSEVLGRCVFRIDTCAVRIVNAVDNWSFVEEKQASNGVKLS